MQEKYSQKNEEIMGQNKCIECGMSTKGKGLRCRSCAIKKQHKDNPRVGKNHPSYKHGKYCKDNINYCIDCGIKLKSCTSKRCCSCNCRIINLGRKRDLRGSKNPMYGTSKLSEKEAIINNTIIGWYKWEVFRKKILERDKHICQKCSKIGNTIHHIKNRRDFPELCWNKENVITVCKGCHIKIDRPKNPKGNNQYVK